MSTEDLIREAQDPATSAARLAELAQADRSTWPAIVFHPAAYDGLLQWLGERGDPTVNAALTARASHVASLSAQAQPAAPVAPAPPAAAAQPPVEEPTVVIPAEPAAEPVAEPAADPTPEPTALHVAPEPKQTAPTAQTPAAPEHTAVFPAQPAAYPSAYPAAPTTAFGAVPPGGAPAGTDGTDGTNGTGKPSGKSLGFVIALVVIIIALIGGAAYGATQVFGDDDDDTGISATDTRETEKPDTTDEEDDDTSPATPAVPTIPTPDSSGALAPFCTSMKTVQDQSMDMLGESGSSPDLDSMQDKAEDMIRSYQELEQAAPAEIKADVRTMSSYLDMLKDPTGDNARDFDMTQYTEAAQRVGVYYAQNCL